MEIEGILCLNLRRSGGCVRYADLMVRSLPVHRCYHLISSFRREPTVPSRAKCIQIPTYQNKTQFVAGTLTILPMLCLLIALLRFRGVNTLYAPYQHFWNPPLLLCARLVRMNVISTIHEPAPVGGGWYSRVVRSRNRAGLWLADIVIFLTTFVHDITSEQGLLKSGQPTLVLPHGIISPEGLRKAPRRHPKRNGQRFQFLFFGRVARNKGVGNLLKAYAQLQESDAELSIVGKWEMSRDELPTIPENVTVIDKYVDEKTLIQTFEEHDALILPYTRASQSGVITLAIAARMPMIVTDVGGLTEQVEDGKTALIVSPNVDAITRGMKRLLEDAELYEGISMRLARAEKGKLSWDALASELIRYCEGRGAPRNDDT